MRNGDGEMLWKNDNKKYTGFWVNGEPYLKSKIRLSNENIDFSRNDPWSDPYYIYIWLQSNNSWKSEREKEGENIKELNRWKKCF